MGTSQHPHDHLLLTPAVFHILLALAGGEQHGDAIMKTVEANSDGQTRMGPGTLKRLLALGMVEESDERPDPRSTISAAATTASRVSDSGCRARRCEVRRMNRLVQVARRHPALGES